MSLVILVNESDKAIGMMEKMRAHKEGALHRAFSVFIFNSNGELLLQKRAKSKYHSGALWTNTCCSHPDLGDDIAFSAQKRLFAEMGLSCTLEFLFSECYNLIVSDGLIEHEFDHVFYGICDDAPCPDPAEVEAVRYMNYEELEQDIEQYPECYSAWFKLFWKEVFARIRNKSQRNTIAALNLN
jgi:isopentenyl-diphosphate delta-isomerase